MKAMVFAAGKGTRLKPITDNIPKALVEVAGKTLLGHVLIKLRLAGVKTVIINVHHLAATIYDHLKKNNNYGLNIHISDESDQLLDTGGGLLKAAPFFKNNEDFFVYNVDILSDINLTDLMLNHKNRGGLATIAVRQRQTKRYFLFDKNLLLAGWENTASGEKILSKGTEDPLTALAFSGIHAINSNIFKHITEKGTFSMTPLYLRLAAQHNIFAYRHDDTQWYDTGNHDTLRDAENNFRFSY